MYEILLVLHVIIALALIGFILLQQGKGAQAGAAFGSGASQTIFGSQGSGGFLSRTTGILAALFFILNLFLAYWINKNTHRRVAVPPAITKQIDQSANPSIKNDENPPAEKSTGPEVPDFQ